MKRGIYVLIAIFAICAIMGIGLAARPSEPVDPLSTIWAAITGLQTNDTTQDDRLSALETSDVADDARLDNLEVNMTKVIECQVGKLDCDRDWLSNGCEVNPLTDVNNCGGCGSVCNLPNADEVCMSGTCNIAQCHPPIEYGDCDGIPANGCEVRLWSDNANCGSCGNVCPANAHCYQGSCECYHAYASCDGNWANGCEVDWRSNNEHCGGCTPCPAGQHCTYDTCYPNP